jgi:hypothetical protein
MPVAKEIEGTTLVFTGTDSIIALGFSGPEPLFSKSLREKTPLEYC